MLAGIVAAGMISAMHPPVRRHIALLVCGDICLFIVALFFALTLRHGAWPSRTLALEHLGPFFILALLSALVFFIAGLYDTHVAFIRRDIPTLIIRTQAVNVLLSVLLFFLVPVGITPKTTLALSLIVSTALIVWWRLFLFPLFSSGMRAHAVIVGSGDEVKELAHALGTHPQFGCVCVEVVDIGMHQSAEALQGRLREVVSRSRVDSIIADMSDEYAKRLAPMYYNLAFFDARVRFFRISDVYEQVFRRVPLSLIGKTWFLENVRAGAPRHGYAALKRAGDIIGVLILLAPCLVLFLIIVCAIKLSDRGRALYTAERVGQHQRPIYLYKFRTMTGMDSGEILNTAHTVTLLGRFLRTTRLDELPQLWNIVRGDLSFVGPRPETPGRARVYAECIPYYFMRHLVKPGLSGWAQISNFDVPHGEVDIPRTMDKLSFDLFYLKHYSLLFDLEIILKTIKTLLLHSGS